jgi:hypothetical protein
MRKIKTALYCVAACLYLFLFFSSLSAQAPKSKRINRAIELLQQGQPIYYTGSHSGTTGSFEQGKKDAQTYADYISYDMEHAPFDVSGLAEYMKGLAAGGPTRSGHRTPAVIVNVPVNGSDEAAVRANAWMFSQVLGRRAFTASCWPMRIHWALSRHSSKPCGCPPTSRRGIAPWRETGRQVRLGQRGREPESSRHRFRGVGSR